MLPTPEAAVQAFMPVFVIEMMTEAGSRAALTKSSQKAACKATCTRGLPLAWMAGCSTEMQARPVKPDLWMRRDT